MIDLDADTLTLRRRPVVVEQFDGTPPPFAIVQSSPVVSRRPRADEPLAVLLHIAMRKPEIWRLPFADAVYCSECGTYQRASAFPKNHTRGQGMSYWCKSCHAEYSRKWRAEQAAAEGREIRPYRRRFDEKRAA